MKLISPLGARISVSDERGVELLKNSGYRRAQATPVPPASRAPRRTKNARTES